MNLLKSFGMMIALISLSVTTAFAEDHWTKPNLTQSVMETDVKAYYTKWVGGTIEDVTVDKGEGDGYLAKYGDAPTAYPMYVVKGMSIGYVPSEWKALDPSIKDVGSSEGLGYGMLITSLMADYDTDAQKYFDGLMNTYLRHPSVVTEYTKDQAGNEIEIVHEMSTMSWLLPSKYSKNGTQFPRTTSATDGDLDIAYALLVADKKWGTPGSNADPDVVSGRSYKQIALTLIKDIEKYLISDRTHRILMGNWAFFSDNGNTYGSSNEEKRFNHTVSRPSDWMLSYLRTFNKYYPSAKWDNAIEETLRILDIVSDPDTGLVPDFMEDDNFGNPVVANKSITKYGEDDFGNEFSFKAILERWQDDMYSDNACRVPWRLAMDYILHNTNPSRLYLTKVAAWTNSLGPARLRKDWGEAAANNWWKTEGGYEDKGFPRNFYPGGYTLDGRPVYEHFDYNTGEPASDPDWYRHVGYTAKNYNSPLAYSNVAVTGTDVNGVRASDQLTKAWTDLARDFVGDHTSDWNSSDYYPDSINLIMMILVSGMWEEPAPAGNYKNIDTGAWYTTLQAAVDAAGSGDTIHIFAREDHVWQQTSIVNIENKNNLTITTNPGAVPVDLSVSSRYGSGINIINSKNITIKNLNVSGALGGSIYVDANSSDIVLDQLAAIYGNMGGTRLVLNGSNITVKNSLFSGRSVYSSSVIRTTGVTNVKFYNNVIIGYSMDIDGSAEIYNNTLLCPINIQSGNAKIKNNVFHDTLNISGQDMYDITIASGASATIDYNLYKDSTKTVSGGSYGANKVIGDPLLVDTNFNKYDKSGFELKSGSPAIDAGVVIAGMPTVPDGNPDLGFKEAVNAAAIPMNWAMSTSYEAGDKARVGGNTYISVYGNSAAQPGVAEYPMSPWEKLGSDSYLVDDKFYWGTDSWYNWYNSSNSAYSSMYNENGVLRTDIYNGGKNVWDVLICKNFPAEEGTYYTVVFDAKTQSQVDIQAVVCMSGAPYTAYSKYETFTLTSGMKQYSFTFRMDSASDASAKVEFDLGGEETPQDIWIDNVRVIKR